MDGKLEFRCPKCGKLLNGLSMGYKWEWECSECASDKTDVLHCERGCKVKAVNLDGGFPCDANQANAYLKEGEIYTVDSVEVGSWCSTITLKEIPDQKFNTVHFVRCA